MPADFSIRLVGIAGGSASGKTTFARALAAALGASATIVEQDAYYRDRSHVPARERTELNFDHPDAIEFPLLVDHLVALREGSAVDMPRYDFASHRRLGKSRRVSPAPIVIVEGMLVLHDDRLRALTDVAVFVAAGDDLRLARRIVRDVRERGRSVEGVIEQYFRTVKPMHEQFVEPQRRRADFLVDTAHEDAMGDAVKAVCSRLWTGRGQESVIALRGSRS